MNLTYRLYIAAALVVSLVFVGWRLYNSGWDNGRAALVAEQQAKAQAQLAKQTTRQQANDSKAAAADESGKATAEVITRDVIKYIKTPGRSEPQFSDERVRIKSTAADNAACIPEFDDCSVQTGTGK
ncbi:MAG: hypothetical protein RSE62_12760 [Citrobacter sp.]